MTNRPKTLSEAKIRFRASRVLARLDKEGDKASEADSAIFLKNSRKCLEASLRVEDVARAMVTFKDLKAAMCRLI